MTSAHTVPFIYIVEKIDPRTLHSYTGVRLKMQTAPVLFMREEERLIKQSYMWGNVPTKKAISLSFKCDQDWDAMTTITDGGKFCDWNIYQVVGEVYLRHVPQKKAFVL